ncbi:hypothetical protein FDH01_gp318 [Acinetobacter phage vB_AbaM_ME3]|uniref:Uncharacterized protein n=1 Tax=Acinetobacter phage vB_AbaM_ME3 TaxID=1837876 RepID=A0A172Q0D6_9CAUD|nr:hypothetical protein FDH01_gp318 [Acinetobacter phage vB_AbaM_ME3]AND75304.1 hypothetical protein ME3_143 [Acinetobacter phage vB_AbaM_ME3]
MYLQILENERPSSAVARQLWTDLRNVSASSNAISRLVHNRSSRRWTAAEDAEVVAAFNAAVALAPSGAFNLSTPDERKLIFRNVALKVKRSPRAVEIRLGALGTDLKVRKAPAQNELADLIRSQVTSHFSAE